MPNGYIFEIFAPDTLKMHSLPLSVIRLLCKTFCKSLKLRFQKTLFGGWFFKKSYIQIKNLYGYKLVRAGKQSDATSSAEGITQSSGNYLCQRKSKYLGDL